MSNMWKKISANDFKNNEYLLEVINYNSLSIQPIGDISFSITGNINDQNEWDNLCLIKMDDFSTVLEVEEKGIYSTDISGIDFIKITAENIDSNAGLNVKVVS